MRANDDPRASEPKPQPRDSEHGSSAPLDSQPLAPDTSRLESPSSIPDPPAGTGAGEGVPLAAPADTGDPRMSQVGADPFQPGAPPAAQPIQRDKRAWADAEDPALSGRY